MGVFSGKVNLLGALGRKRVWRHSSCRAPEPPRAVARVGNLLGFNLPDVWANCGGTRALCEYFSSRAGKIETVQHKHHYVSGPENVSTATIINGKLIATTIKSEITSEIQRLRNATGKQPGLAVVLVDQRRESHSFVRIKIKACEEVGIAATMAKLPANCTEDQVLGVVSELNRDSSVHGIIVQLPLPEHVDEEKILDIISPDKDVDGFHPLNMGNLALRVRQPLFVPSAAKACIELLLRSGVDIAGKNTVVFGRSKIVGLPTSLLLQRYDATVSVVHALSENPHLVTREADILITDVGFPNVIRGSWLKPGAVVIDTGTIAVKDPSFKQGFRIAGDVCFAEAIKIASAITPVPGGAGPVTITMLLSNILDSFKRAHDFL